MSDYDEFVKRMGSFDMDLSLDDIGEDSEELEHYGIKGMKWGVRRPVGTDGTVIKKKSTTRRQIESKVREVKMVKSIKNLDSKSDDEVRDLTTRIRNENELKRLTPASPITKKGKVKRDLYLDRTKLSNEELQNKVNRLRLEDQLKLEVGKANKESIQKANEVIQKVGKFAVKRYVNSGNFAPTSNPAVNIVLRETLNYAATNDKVIRARGVNK